MDDSTYYRMEKAEKDLEKGENIKESLYILYPHTKKDRAVFESLFKFYKAEAERGQPTGIEVSGLGRLVKGGLDELCTKPLPIPVLGSDSYPFVLVDYLEDPDKDDFHQAVTNFMALDRSILKRARGDIFKYYKDYRRDANFDFIDFVLKKVWFPSLILRYVEMGEEVYVRRCDDDREVYVTIGCECSWAPEHGMMLVFRGGLVLTKLGPNDGCLTNSDKTAIYESF